MVLSRRNLIRAGLVGSAVLASRGAKAKILRGSSQAVSPFIIVLNQRASVSGAPASFMQGVQAAANILMAAIKSPITVSIDVGYDELQGSPSLGAGAGGATLRSNFFAYSTIRTQLLSVQATADQASFNSTLPATSSFNGVPSFLCCGAIQKAIGGLGIAARDISTPDGIVGIGAGVPDSSLVGVALHELTHAMGRNANGSNDATFNWTRYTGVGTRTFATSSIPANYFSIDGGTTNLAFYSTGSDPSDFSGANTSDDVFNNNYTPGAPYTQNLSAVDKQLLNVIGFTV